MTAEDGDIRIDQVYGDDRDEAPHKDPESGGYAYAVMAFRVYGEDADEIQRRSAAHGLAMAELSDEQEGIDLIGSRAEASYAVLENLVTSLQVLSPEDRHDVLHQGHGSLLALQRIFTEEIVAMLSRGEAR